MTSPHKECKGHLLWQAAEAGEIEKVEKMLEDPGINLSWEDPQFNQTALNVAAQNGHLKVVQLFLSDRRLRILPSQNDFEGPLHTACSSGHLNVVEELLLDSRIDVNQQDLNKFTPLCLACMGGHTQVVQRLLKDPRVDPNRSQFLGATPFFIACREGYVDLAKLLLGDPKVDVNKADNFNASPLYVAAFMGHLDVVKWILASDREIHLSTRRLGRASALEISQQKNFQVIADLLMKFEKNSQATRRELQQQLKIADRKASDTFSLIVLLCDGYFRLGDHPCHLSDSSLRFFKIARRLPMELQMVLANRLYDLNKEFVSVRSSETSLREIFRTCS